MHLISHRGNIDGKQAEKEKKKGGGFSFGKKAVKPEDVMIFSKQFATMVKAGLPILNVLTMLRDQIEHPTGEINVLVGDEVAGAISAELLDVPWDKAFQALLDMKNFAADIDVSNNIIRVHSPSILTSQESYKSARASAVKKIVELEDSV